ncbi:MAG: hypothetical protein ACRD5W_11420 [Candidatus Acidiferrales bacterium]
MKLHSLFGELVNLDQLPDHYEAAHHRKARDVMTRCVPSVDADGDFRRLVELMIENQLARVVVFNKLTADRRQLTVRRTQADSRQPIAHSKPASCRLSAVGC